MAKILTTGCSFKISYNKGYFLFKKIMILFDMFYIFKKFFKYLKYDTIILFIM